MRRVLAALAGLALAAGCMRGQVVRHGAVDADALAGVRRTVTDVRGLEFTAPVPAHALGRDAMRAALARQIDLAYAPGDLERLQTVYVRLGLLAPGTDLRAALDRMYEEEAAGFYDPRARELVLAAEALRPGGPGLRLLSFVSGRDPVGEFFLGHELTHALQDEHYGLPTAPEPLTDAHGDRLLARHALLEGDATLTGFAVVVREPLAASTVAPLGPELRAIPGELARRYPDLPALLRETLAFQYADGAAFVTAALAAGGRDALDRIHRDPPDSTTQVLHPDRYLAARRRPAAVALGGTGTLEAGGWTRVVEDTIGEFQTRVLAGRVLPAPQAAEVARGWAGDRLRALARGDALVIVWLTTWDSVADASEFAAALPAVIPEASSEQREARVLVVLVPPGDGGVDAAALAAAVWRGTTVAAARDSGSGRVRIALS